MSMHFIYGMDLLRKISIWNVILIMTCFTIFTNPIILRYFKNLYARELIIVIRNTFPFVFCQISCPGR